MKVGYWKNKKFSEQHKRNLADAQRGNKNINWKGDAISYKSLHIYLRRHIAKPELCQYCKKVPPHDLANVTGIYNRDPKNWKYLCSKCHFHDDGRSDTFRHRKKHSLSTIKKMSESHRGKRHSQESRTKISKARIDYWKKRHSFYKG